LDCFCEEWKPYYPLVAAIRKRSDEYAIIPDDHLVNVHLTINGPDVMILSGKHYPDVTFSREDVTSVQYDRDSGVLDVTLFDDGVWCLEFERRRDARAFSACMLRLLWCGGIDED